MLIVILTGFLQISEAKDPVSSFDLVLTYNEQEVHLQGNVTFSNSPGMRSFYFEDTNSIRCSIHVIRLGDDILTAGTYPIGTDDEPRAGVVCGIPHDGDSKERAASRSGKFVIDELEGNQVSGRFEARLIGGRTGIEYHITGKFVALPHI